MMDSTDATPWYRDGLAFSCTRCGACCTGAPGFVWVEIDEIERLAAHERLTPDEFGRRYLRRIGDRISLIEYPNGDCVFWRRDIGCTVYEARPEQCRTWPFWPGNVTSPATWERTRLACPGAGRGTHHDLVQIEDALRRTPV